MPSGGQNDKYSTETADKFIELVSQGELMLDAAIKCGVSIASVQRWRVRNVQFDEACLRALKVATHLQVDNLTRISDTEPDVQRARLKCDNIKWAAARRFPEVYGDRIDVNHSGHVDISAALNEASTRALRLRRDLENVSDAEIVEIKQLEDNGTTGSRPLERVDSELEDLLS